MVKCLRFWKKREIASLSFAFARGFTWFASGSLIYCVLLNAIVEKTRNSQLFRVDGGDRDGGGVDRVPLMSNFTKLCLFVCLV